MLTSYIRAAMRQARYEIIEDDRSFYGEIPAIPGVWANAKTLEACREELESVLEGWVLLSIADRTPIPDIDGHLFQSDGDGSGDDQQREEETLHGSGRGAAPGE